MKGKRHEDNIWDFILVMNLRVCQVTQKVDNFLYVFLVISISINQNHLHLLSFTVQLFCSLQMSTLNFRYDDKELTLPDFWSLHNWCINCKQDSEMSSSWSKRVPVWDLHALLVQSVVNLCNPHSLFPDIARHTSMNNLASAQRSSYISYNNIGYGWLLLILIHQGFPRNISNS